MEDEIGTAKKNGKNFSITINNDYLKFKGFSPKEKRKLKNGMKKIKIKYGIDCEYNLPFMPVCFNRKGTEE